jgi:hypothetical protein
MARVAPQLNANDYLASGSSGRRLTIGILTGTVVKRTPDYRPDRTVPNVLKALPAAQTRPNDMY